MNSSTEKVMTLEPANARDQRANPAQPADETAEVNQADHAAATRALAELLLPDPSLMGSPEGDKKGLRELQQAAEATIEQSRDAV